MDPDARAEVALAVRKALAEYGYERLTTAKIAQHYANSEAGLYYYFDSKDEMIAAFLEHAAANVTEDLSEIDTSDPENALRTACKRLFRSPDDPDSDMYISIMELLSHAPHNETIREPLVEMETACINTLAEIVRTGVERGVFQSVDPRTTAAFLLAAADGSTGYYVALELAAGDTLEDGWSMYIDGLLAEQ
jgi:AcrR family transcriptional regulator